MGIGTLVYALIALTVLTLLRSGAVPHWVAVREKQAQFYGFLGESLEGREDIRGNGGRTPALIERESNANRLQLMVKDRLFSQILSSIYQNNVYFSTGLVLVLAAGRVNTGTLSLGDLAIFIYYMAFASEFVRQLGSYVTTYQQAAVSAGRLQEAMEGSPATDLVRHVPIFEAAPDGSQDFDETQPRQPLRELAVRGLTYFHPRTGRGAADISLDVPRGTTTVITGGVGAGKSTLLGAILGLLPSQRGEMLWNGQMVAAPSEFFVPPHAAFVPQVPRLAAPQRVKITHAFSDFSTLVLLPASVSGPAFDRIGCCSPECRWEIVRLGATPPRIQHGASMSAQVAVSVAVRLGRKGRFAELKSPIQVQNGGAGRGARTLKTLRSADFKSAAFADFAIPARFAQTLVHALYRCRRPALAYVC